LDIVRRGRVDGRYSVIEPLGEGGMAEVFLARDEVLGREVALKVLNERYAHDGEIVERFRREAQSMATLSHPNIVSVFDQGTSEDGAYYMAMEYLSGGSLKDYLADEGRLSPEATIERWRYRLRRP